MRIVFAGTPQAAVPSLRLLANDPDITVAAVVTREDAPRGRRRVLTPSDVAAAAAERHLPVIKTNRLDANATEAITAVQADLGVIVAYGGLVREPLLSAPRHGWINLHFSLLPAWRGAAPVQHALLAGDRVTGASVFQLVPELDAGDVYGTSRFEIPRGATAADLLTDLADAGAELLRDVVHAIRAGTAEAVPQQGAVTLAPKLTAADGELDFAAPIDTVVNRYRATTPEPGAFTTVDGARVKVLDAHRGRDLSLSPGEIAWHDKAVVVGAAEGTLQLVRVQPAGKPAMNAADWFRGLRHESPRAGS